MLQVYFGKGKSPLHPPTYDGWDTSPLSLWKWIFYLLDFLKQDKAPLKQFWKS
jgi:hypothetical protein